MQTGVVAWIEEVHGALQQEQRRRRRRLGCDAKAGQKKQRFKSRKENCWVSPLERDLDCGSAREKCSASLPSKPDLETCLLSTHDFSVV